MPLDLDVQEDVSALDLGNKIRGLRKRKNLTLQNVADRTGLSAPLLSQIENEITAPPLATLIKISKALGVTISYFFRESSSTDRISVVRKSEYQQPNVSRPGQFSNVGYSFKALSLPMIDRHMEPFLVEFESRPEEEMLYYNHFGEEFLFVQEGRLEFRGGEQVTVLEPGDCLYFDSGIPHALRSIGNDVAKALVVIYSPR